MGRQWRQATPAGLMLLLVVGCTQQECGRAEKSRQEWQSLCQRLGWPAGTDQTSVASWHVPDPRDRETADRAVSGSLESVVQIRTRMSRRPQEIAAGGTMTATPLGGSGIVVRRRGLVLTNAHVVDQAEEVSVVAPNGSEYRATRMAVDPQLDLAMLWVDELDCPIAPCLPADIRCGQKVAAVGHHLLGSGPEVRAGLVLKATVSLQNQLDPTGQRCYRNLIEDTAMIEPGFSGGPLIDMHGRLIGINVATATPPGARHRRGYAIPLNASVLRRIGSLADRLAVTAAED